jgi:F0F1-type ATP synthase membrane subunit c/vacuolar-type H+-ATPase subunit K
VEGMLSPVWLFVIAAIIAVFGIIFGFKVMIAGIESKLENKIPLNQQTLQPELTRFFITIGIVETIPIILLVLGFSQLDTLYNQQPGDKIMIPFSIVIITILFGIINVVITRSRLFNENELTNESRNLINTIAFIGIGMVSAVPSISIIALLLLLLG